jgi:hypothetical protein
MHDIAAGEQNVHGAEESVRQGIEVLGSKGSQPHQAHPIMFF